MVKGSKVKGQGVKGHYFELWTLNFRLWTTCEVDEAFLGEFPCPWCKGREIHLG